MRLSIALRYLTVGPAIASRAEMLETRRLFTLMRRYVRDLEFSNAPAFGDIVQPWWESLFSQTPHLEKIDLNGFRDRPFTRAAEIVRAVANQCRGLRDLVAGFPVHSDFWLTPDVARALPQAAFYAMEKLYNSGGQGGLREMSVGMQDFITSSAPAATFVGRLIQFCPSVERLAGHCQTMRATDEMTCQERWTLDLVTWARFCESLSCLTEFSWLPVPFATKYFEVFGQYVKPHLQNLTIDVSMNWDWPHFFSTISESTEAEVRESGFGASAKNLHTVLRACPNLKQLSLNWFNPPNESDTRHLSSNFTNYVFPRERRMDPNVFGDDFCEALVTYCPHLEDLTVTSILLYAPYEGYVKSFTDRGVRALAKLPMLTHAEIDVVCVTGASLFSLIADHVVAT